MPKISVFDFSEIPLYPVQIRQLADENQTDIKSELAEWVNKKNETGKLGENIAFRYLQTKFKEVYPATKDSYGYDIQADNLYFEIKTSKHLRSESSQRRRENLEHTSVPIRTQYHPLFRQRYCRRLKSAKIRKVRR